MSLGDTGHIFHQPWYGVNCVMATVETVGTMFFFIYKASPLPVSPSILCISNTRASPLSLGSSFPGSCGSDLKYPSALAPKITLWSIPIKIPSSKLHWRQLNSLAHMEVRLYIDIYPLRPKDLPYTAKCATISSSTTVIPTAGTLNVTRTTGHMQDQVARGVVAVPIYNSNWSQEIAHNAIPRYKIVWRASSAGSRVRW